MNFAFLFSFLILLLGFCGCRNAPSGTIAWEEFDGRRALAHVERQVAIGPRHVGSDGHAALQRYLLDQLKGLGLTAREQQFEQKTPRGLLRFKNIIVEIRGQTPALLLIGAHYDTKYFPHAEFVGANDGAAATGALLEIARVLTQRPPAATVWLVFFDGEEALEHWSETDGVYGSRYLVGELRRLKDLERIGAVMILDMIGDRDLTVTLPPESSAGLVQIVLDAAAALGVRRHFSILAHSLTDDHTPFLEAGVPAVNVIDFQFGRAAGGNDYWHTAEDTLDKISAESLETAGRVVLRAADEIVRRLSTGARFAP